MHFHISPKTVKKWWSHSLAEGGESQRRSERGDPQLTTQGPTLPRTEVLEETVGPHCYVPSDRLLPLEEARLGRS